MTVDELVIICQAHEGIMSGGRNCKYINKAYKLLPNNEKKVTKNKKILAINEYFNQISNQVLAKLLVEKYEREGISGKTL